MTDLKYSEYGYTTPSDSIKCPNCGHKYGEVSAKVPSKNRVMALRSAELAMQQGEK